MESWRLVWRTGFAPVLSTEGLRALAEALRTDDPRLTQRATVVPEAGGECDDMPPEACCPVGFVGAVVSGGFEAATVGIVSEFFGRACFEADQLLGEPAAVRWFLNFVDDVPRDVLRRELLPEVELVLSSRSPAAAA